MEYTSIRNFYDDDGINPTKEPHEFIFELSYTFTPGEKADLWGDYPHPEWPPEIDVYEVKCVQIDDKVVDGDNDIDRWFWEYINDSKLEMNKIYEKINEEMNEREYNHE